MTPKHFAAAAAFAFLGTAAHANDEDTFRIDVVLAELDTDQGADEFEERLSRAARNYCKDNYAGNSRRALRDCEAAVVAAVHEALEDGEPIRVAANESR